MEAIVNWIVETIGRLGYAGIVCLMALESSFFPFPSEVVMTPAGYLAHQGEMNLVAVILLGIVGSLAGAYFNYSIAWYLGRPFIIRFGKYVGITEKKFSKVESYFEEHGEITTFIGRLIPGIRQIISFPAGLGGNESGSVLYLHRSRSRNLGDCPRPAGLLGRPKPRAGNTILKTDHPRFAGRVRHPGGCLRHPQASVKERDNRMSPYSTASAMGSIRGILRGSEIRGI